ncbi:MAG: TonB C-terminal domain-containing protein [Helicobacteraceae bacterium]|nr:TonB C-terminal domain-containing protein [Helicobacteraceae bacterium]
MDNAIDVLFELPASPQANEPLVDEEVNIPPPMAKKIRELWGESNATVEKVAEEIRKEEINRPLSESLRVVSRLDQPKPVLQAFKAVNTAGGAQGGKPDNIESRYYSEVVKRLHAAWQASHSDLGKMAVIKMRIERGGQVSYTIVRYSGDQPFIDRLEGALERIKATGLEPPSRLLVLDVNFKVEE